MAKVNRGNADVMRAFCTGCRKARAVEMGETRGSSMFCLRLLARYGMCGSTGTTCSAYGGFGGLKWGLLEPRGGFQSVLKRQSAEQLYCTVIEITLIPPLTRCDSVSYARLTFRTTSPATEWRARIPESKKTISSSFYTTGIFLGMVFGVLFQEYPDKKQHKC